MHSHSSPPPNRLWRGIVEIENPPCGGPCELAPMHSPEERDLFTTAKLACCRGTVENGPSHHHRRAKDEVQSSQPASRRSLRDRLHGTMHAPVGVEPTYPERSIRALHHRQICIQGNGRRGPLGLANEEIRVFTTWNLQNSPSFPHDKGFGAAGNKNPSGAVSSGGVRKRRTFQNGLNPFHLREKARAHQPRRKPMASARSASAG
jgi:hypothetical protein